jgi:Cysteine rich repeat
MLFCMLAHEDKISDKCVNTLLDIADDVELAVSNVARAADACDEDIDKVCGNADPGEGRIAQCLIDNQAKVSSACRAEVAGFQARMKK